MVVYFIIGAVLLFGALLLSNYLSKRDLSYEDDYVTMSAMMSDYEIVLFDAMNKYRVENKKKYLYSDHTARLSAEAHTTYMISVDRASHDNYSDRAIALMNKGVLSVGECVGYGYNSPEGFLRGYINSPSHNTVLLGNFTHIGVRCLKSYSGRYYNTLIFIKV